MDENIAKLSELFPEAFTEGKIDFDMLQKLLGANIETEKERYSFTWNGKSEAIKIALKQSTGTLRPDKESSKNWDTTKNLYIEGDNLEVLRLLQAPYRGKVKMIYIDPPYNTGNDFVYNDKFSDTVEDYKESIGETQKTNADTSGRYHTNWLNMMFPRLKLARNLLSDDGIIFISIDDNEQANLKKICDEIFGEEEFIGTITWEKRTKAQNTETARDQFQSRTEYILVYSKLGNRMRFKLKVTGVKTYEHSDEKGVYREKMVEEMSSLGMRGRETMIFPILGVRPRENKQWKIGKDQISFFEQREDVFLRDGKVYLKIRPDDELNERFMPFWSHFFDKETYGTAETGKSELSEVLGTKAHGFETVKPVTLIKKLLFHLKDTNGIESQKNDIIIDCFSGSGTTAQAIMELNSEDGGNRKFIMIQYPEVTEESSETYKAGYKTISELCIDRIKKAGQKIYLKLKEKQETLVSLPEDYQGMVDIDKLDVGFKAFKLDTTNLSIWDEKTEDLEQTLLDNVDAIKDGRTEEDVLYEVLIKYGIDLTVPIEEEEVGGKKIYLIAGGYLTICLEDGLDLAFIEELAKRKPQRVVFRDTGFKDDTVKTNAEMTLRKHGVEDIKVL